MRHDGRYPEEIYIQLDGGSENANQYLFAMLELLVAKRVAKIFYYTRLPVGHTHCDVDAAFAVIWKLYRMDSIMTLKEYREDY